MFTLFSWVLKDCGPAVLAYGVVSDYPKLPEGESVHTSPVRRVTEEGGLVLLETASGSVYSLRPEELSESAGGPDDPLPPPDRLELPPGFWTRCMCARDRALRSEEEALRQREAPGTLRLRLAGVTALSALWRGPGESVQRIPIHIHLGRLQDSVLVTNIFEAGDSNDRVDFRYFPMWQRIEPYRIYRGIETILIVNEDVQDVAFGRQRDAILCVAGETTRIAVKNHTMEWRKLV